MAVQFNNQIGECLVDNRTVGLPFAPGIAINPNDLVWWDPVNLVVKPANAMADQGSLVANQRYFAANFLGVAKDGWLASETDTGTASYRTVTLDGIFNYLCQSQAFAIGTLIGIDRNSAVPANYNTQVNNVSSGDLAIGVYVPNRDVGLTITNVRIRITTAIAVLDIVSALTTATQSANSGVLPDSNIVMDYSYPQILNQTPSVGRTINLPPAAQSNGLQYFYANRSGGASATFVSSTNATIMGNGVVPAGKTAIFWFDSNALQWAGNVSA